MLHHDFDTEELFSGELGFLGDNIISTTTTTTTSGADLKTLIEGSTAFKTSPSKVDVVQMDVCLGAASNLIKEQGITDVDELRSRLLGFEVGITPAAFDACQSDIMRKIIDYMSTANKAMVTTAPPPAPYHHSAGAGSSELVRFGDMRDMLSQAVAPALRQITTVIANNEERYQRDRREDAKFVTDRLNIMTQKMDRLEKRFSNVQGSMSTTAAHLTGVIRKQGRETTTVNTMKKITKMNLTPGTSQYYVLAYLMGCMFFTRIVNGVEVMVLGNTDRLMAFDFDAHPSNSVSNVSLRGCALRFSMYLENLQTSINDNPHLFQSDHRSVDDELDFSNIKSYGITHLSEEDRIYAGLDESSTPRTLMPILSLAALEDLAQDRTAKFYVATGAYRGWSSGSLAGFRTKNVTYQQIITKFSQMGLTKSSVIPNEETPEPFRELLSHSRRPHMFQFQEGALTLETLSCTLDQLIFKPCSPILSAKAKVYNGGFHPIIYYGTLAQIRRPKRIYRTNVGLLPPAPVEQEEVMTVSAQVFGDIRLDDSDVAELLGQPSSPPSSDDDDNDDEEETSTASSPVSPHFNMDEIITFTPHRAKSILGTRKASAAFTQSPAAKKRC